MGSLALLLKESGYHVTGSDENVYPPMSTQLENAGIQVMKGYKEENLRIAPSPRPSPQRGEGEALPDLFIIRNVISRGNPEAEKGLGQ